MANGIEVAKAYVTIIPSMEGSQREISEQLTGAASSAGQSAGKAAGSGFGSSLVSGLKTAGVAVSTLATAATATGTKLFNMANGVSKYGDEIEKNSQRVGMSAEAYQKWDYAMQISGTSMQDCTVGLKTLTNKFDDAIHGSEGAVETFARLGLSMEDISGMSREDLFATVVSSLQNVKDETEKAAIANDLFGRSGQNLLPMFNMTNEATKDLLDETEKYGLVMSDQAVKDSAAFQDSLTKLSSTMKGTKNSMVGELLPGITQVMDGLSDLVAGNEGATEQIQQGAENVIQTINGLLPNLSTLILTIASAVMTSAPSILQSLATGIIEALPILIPAAVSMITQITESLITLLPMLVSAAFEILFALANGIAEAIPTLIPQIVEVVTQIVQTLIENAPTLIMAAIELIFALANGLIDAIPQLLEAVPSLITAVCDGLINNLPQIIEMGLRLVISLVQGIIQNIPRIVAAIPQIISSLVSGFMSQMSKVLEIGRNLVTGIWNGISAAGSWLWDKITGWANSIISGIKGLFGIRSPSKVMSEMGYFLDVGLAEGITDNIGLVDSAARSMEDAVTGELSGVSATIGTNASMQLMDNRSSDIALILSALRSIQMVIEEKDLTLDGRKLTETVTKYQRQSARAFG